MTSKTISPSKTQTLTFDGSILREALRAVGTATSSVDVCGDAVKIRGNKGDNFVWLQTSSVRLSVDYRMRLRETLSDDVSIIVAYPLLNSISRHADGVFSLDIDGSKVVATGKGLRAVLSVYNDLPIKSLWDAEEPLQPLFSAVYSEYETWFKKVSWAADERSERIMFAGPHILRDGDRNVVIASDTMVVALQFVEKIASNADDIQLPTHFLSAVGRLGVGKDEEVVFGTDERCSRVVMKVGDYLVIASPMLAGTFPGIWKNYIEEMDPKYYANFSVSREEIATALQRAVDLATSQQHAKNIYVVMDFDGGVCLVVVTGTSNEVSTEFLYSADDDDSVRLKINPNLLLPFLKKCKEDAVLISVPNTVDANKPLVVSDGVGSSAEYKCIIAPVRG